MNLVEGNAGEFVPDVERMAGMHGFVIMVSVGEGGNWLLDMLWRITMAYAAMPSPLCSPANVRKMVEAVTSHENRSVDVVGPRRAQAPKKETRRRPN